MLSSLACAAFSLDRFPYHTAAALSITKSGPARKSTCKRLPGLTEKQVRWCKSHHVFMQPIVSGTKLGLDECKRRFETRRWSCPIGQPDNFGKALATGKTMVCALWLYAAYYLFCTGVS